MSVTFTAQDKAVVRTAAYGAVALMSAAAAAGSPHKAAAHGSIALASATGRVGYVLAEKSKIKDLGGRSVAEMADRVLPALAEAMSLLRKQDAAEAENFRSTVAVAVEAAAGSQKGGPSPAMADMARKIAAAVDAA